ncbi:MAG: hypothetical protein ACRDTH_07245 [Pseudonocardiaceae bacterium]
MAKRKDRLLVSMMALGAALFLVSFFSGISHESQFRGGLALAAAISGALVSVLPLAEMVWRERRPADPQPTDTLVNSLALVVRAQWRKEATKRRLSPPEPIPVRWSLSNLAVAGPVKAAVGDPDVTPAFRPLPGHTRITEEQLRAGGGRGELFAVYAGIASGRVVVVGAPGAGKTGSAILLVLDALDHRDHVDDKDRAKVPVPVLLTVHGWDPATCSVRDWLASRLAATYPLLQHRGGQIEAAELIDAGAVALILDGLDQMDVAQRRNALRALGDASFRVVVFARSEEMVEAATWLAGAVGLHLYDVSGPEAADYLQRARTEPPPAGWVPLLTHLREDPGSVLTRGLSTPLALTLIRDTYRGDDDVSELLNITREGTGVDLEQRLVGRVLVDAYSFHPGRPKPRYSLPQAERALAFLARQMYQDHTRDLGWWHIPRWASTVPRILASMITVGLLGGLLCALLYALSYLVIFGAPTQDIWIDKLLFGLMIGLGVGIPLGLGGGRGGREPKRVRTWRGISLRSILIAGLAYGVVAGLLMMLMSTLTSLLGFLLTDSNVAPKWSNWLAGAAVGILVGLPLGLRDLLGGLGERQNSLQGHKNRRNNRVAGLVAAIVVAIAFSIVLARPSELDTGVVIGIVIGIMALLVVWLMPRIARGFISGFAEGQDSPEGPFESWRNDRVVGLMVGLAFGLAGGLGFGLGVGLVNVFVVRNVSVLWPGLMNGLAFGLTVGLVYGITASATWATTLAWRLQLQRPRHIPSVDLMPFLEDARDRDVLRIAGAFYQFRHATLQDQLAGRTTANPAASSSAGLSS